MWKRKFISRMSLFLIQKKKNLCLTEFCSIWQSSGFIPSSVLLDYCRQETGTTCSTGNWTLVSHMQSKYPAPCMMISARWVLKSYSKKLQLRWQDWEITVWGIKSTTTLSWGPERQFGWAGTFLAYSWPRFNLLYIICSPSPQGVIPKSRVRKKAWAKLGVSPKMK